jgi:hypothetical protein
MTDEEIEKHNDEQRAKYPEASHPYLIIIPPVLADIARGHGVSLDGYFIGRRWLPPMAHANGDASA